MFAFISALALAAASSSRASHGSKAAPPMGSLKSVFQAGDYPAAALSNNEQGDVGVVVRVDPAGGIADCSVEKTSGSALLDAKTCEVIHARAKLAPARDGRGRAVAGDRHDTIRWRIASEGPNSSGQPSSLKGSLQGLISADDYPKAALDRNEQGDVSILLRVDARGIVSECKVEKSSGSVALDSQTCLLVRQRAKFQPARDASGKAVEATSSAKISWRMADPRPAAAWATTLIMTFNEDGTQSSCIVIGEGAIISGRKTTAPCEENARHRRVEKIADYPASATFSLEQRFEPVAHAPVRSLKDDEELVTRIVLDLEINARGDVTNCKIAAQEGEPPLRDPCVEPRGYYFVNEGSDRKGVPFRATMIYTTYWRIRALDSVAIPSPLHAGR